MGQDYRQVRLAWLRQVQNEDGGWGYFAGKQSWLEPTCYALMALYKDAEAENAFQRGWALVRSWQTAEGWWNPNGFVRQGSWATALCLTLHHATGVHDEGWQRGLKWMVSVRGSEGGLAERALALIKPKIVEYDRRYKGWPWLPESSSWVEPTAHALVALRKAAQVGQLPVKVDQRIAEAESMLCDRRSPDGGWNYGNRRVLGHDLPSYPETTGVALLGLQGLNRPEVSAGVACAQKYWKDTKAPLAKAWLSIALRNHGVALSAPEDRVEPALSDVLITALEAMAAPEGGHQWLKI